MALTRFVGPACPAVRMPGMLSVPLFACSADPSHVWRSACPAVRVFGCSHLLLCAYPAVLMSGCASGCAHVRLCACRLLPEKDRTKNSCSHALRFACPAVCMSGCSLIWRFACPIHCSRVWPRRSHVLLFACACPALRLSSCELARLQVMCADMSDMRGHVRKWYKK